MTNKYLQYKAPIGPQRTQYKAPAGPVLTPIHVKPHPTHTLAHRPVHRAPVKAHPVQPSAGAPAQAAAPTPTDPLQDMINQLTGAYNTYEQTYLGEIPKTQQRYKDALDQLMQKNQQDMGNIKVQAANRGVTGSSIENSEMASLNKLFNQQQSSIQNEQASTLAEMQANAAQIPIERIQAIEKLKQDAANNDMKQFNEYLRLLGIQAGTDKSMLPYTMGPTPYQSQALASGMDRAMIPYTQGATPYQQGQLGLGQQRNDIAQQNANTKAQKTTNNSALWKRWSGDAKSMLTGKNILSSLPPSMQAAYQRDLASVNSPQAAADLNYRYAYQWAKGMRDAGYSLSKIQRDLKQGFGLDMHNLAEVLQGHRGWSPGSKVGELDSTWDKAHKKPKPSFGKAGGKVGTNIKKRKK